jgi:hypothetical protein
MVLLVEYIYLGAMKPEDTRGLSENDLIDAAM